MLNRTANLPGLAATAAMVSVIALVIVGSAHGQQLNQRKTADPQGEAKMSRMMTRGALQAAEQNGDTLKSDDLSDLAVHTDCGPVQIGGTQTDEPKDAKDKEKESLLRRQTSEDDETTTIVPGDVVVICRR